MAAGELYQGVADRRIKPWGETVLQFTDDGLYRKALLKPKSRSLEAPSRRREYPSGAGRDVYPRKTGLLGRTGMEILFLAGTRVPKTKSARGKTTLRLLK